MALLILFSKTDCYSCNKLKANGFYDQIQSLCNEYDNLTFKLIEFDHWYHIVPDNHPRWYFYTRIVKFTPILVIVNRQLHDDPTISDKTLLSPMNISIFNGEIDDNDDVWFKQVYRSCRICNIQHFIENSNAYVNSLRLTIKEPNI